jgi:hypothetical protein
MSFRPVRSKVTGLKGVLQQTDEYCFTSKTKISYSFRSSEFHQCLIHFNTNHHGCFFTDLWCPYCLVRLGGESGATLRLCNNPFESSRLLKWEVCTTAIIRWCSEGQISHPKLLSIWCLTHQYIRITVTLTSPHTTRPYLLGQLP